MSNTVRIRTTPNGSDKYLKVKLEQDFDFIEILSLKISQEDTYRKFCSDYGTIVGRVSVNNGFGVPNAKVSVFIPLDDIDKENPLIKGLYPYEVITDKNDDGVRYNLLPKDGNPTNDCSTPIGTFPNKREVLDNETLSSIYCKYYQFTTTTNHAGDFMLFGVPLGTYTVHVDADVSDIGIISQRPYDLISQGTPSKMFYSPTKFNGGKNLDKLIQVKTLNTSVNVQPFWGDPENCEIGISRVDFDLNHTVRPTAIFMGSIYGDQDKHSINKRCRPRKKLGNLCEQVTGPGSIQMIRKTVENEIEDFDVEGGRVIDDDGAWAYQIPMNLDYMVTAEDGSLILSQDPNVGIPTRARVRFNIGMDETGGEGRLRTRARYLVPNNPQTAGDIDYAFGQDTKDSSFKDIYWNKIYSVSNYISRFQRNTNLRPVKSRSMTAIKDVDGCAGDKTPFPYNRVNTDVNPIFFIICLIIKIIGFLIYVLNSFLIPLINVIISAINTVIGVIVNAINTVIDAINSVADTLGLDSMNTITWNAIPYVGCIHVECPADDGSTFAPGCSKGGGIDGGNAWSTANDVVHLDYYSNDGISGHDSFGSAAGLDDCISFEIAKALNMFQFDFYNDWVNGSLFGFLLKYKKKKKGREKFCEYDCDDFGISAGGVDGNNNNQPDNNCHNNLLLDTCFQDSTGNNWQVESTDSGTIREGLIKKVEDEFYYAATTHNATYKLFATDIISLGSIYDCDWQGIPKVNDLLIPTTYKVPPDIQEIDDDGTIEACGMVDIGTPANAATGGLFFSINCVGLHVSQRQCLNIRHICEFGVDIDQNQEDPLTGAVLYPSDCVIGSQDIDESRGKWFRDVFTGLNSGNTTPYSIGIPSPNGFSTNFNTSDSGTYNFTAVGPNGQDYVDFRGYGLNGTPVGDTSYGQTEHSYFFYFGLLPGKTGLDKMNQRFFTKCNPLVREDLLIKASSTAASPSTGSITFSFYGGSGIYTYTVTGVGSTSYGPTTGSVVGSISTIISGLPAGTYLISGFDSHGNPVSTTVVVSGPPSFYCTTVVTANASAAGINDGKITITSAGGGIPPYFYKVYNGANILISGPSTLITPQLITGLAVDTTVGYKVEVYDSSTPISGCTTTGLTIGGPTSIVAAPTLTGETCFGGNNGGITLNISGGQSPYTISTTGPAGFTSNAGTMLGLLAGVYTTNIVDTLGTTLGPITNVITQPAQMALSMATAYEIGKQCDPTQYIIPFKYTNGATPAELAGTSPLLVQVNIDSTPWTDYGTPIYLDPSNPTTTLMYVNIPAGITSSVKIRFRNASNTCFSNALVMTKTSMELPPAVLAVTPISIPQQCAVGMANLGININYLSRAPYTVNYTINGITQPSFTTSVNPTNWTRPVPSTSVVVVYTITDVKGCTATGSQTVVTPSSVLTVSVSTGSLITTPGPNFNKYPHTITASGGIGTKTLSGYGTYTTPVTIYDTNSTYTATITDSVGCSDTATG